MIRATMLALFASLSVSLAGCAPLVAMAHPTTEDYPATQVGRVQLDAQFHSAPLTVLTFFSAGCPCQRAHDERLKRVREEFAPRGVGFFAVDSEADSSLERDAREAGARGYVFPIISDPGGALADAFGARFATETVIVDREGKVRFRGGIDSDHQTLHDDAHAWLRDALGALVDGKEPPATDTKALGCSLRRR